MFVPDILFEDNHVLVLSKPVNLLTQPSPLGEFSLEDVGKVYLKEKYEKKGNIFLEPIFRLDRVASGIVLFAKTSKALSRLKESSRNALFTKQYVAVIEPPLAEETGICKNYLVHGSHKALCYPFSPLPPHKEAKVSLLSYSTLLIKEKKALLKIDLKTGRYHQIRAQLSFRGSSIVGDEKYGSLQKKEAGIFLHHFFFTFPHPITKETISLLNLPLKDPEWAPFVASIS